MADRYDELIGDAVGAVRWEQDHDGAPLDGAVSARATVAHRRKVRVAVLSALGALLIALPVTALVAHERTRDAVPIPGDSAAPGPTAPPSGEPGPGEPDGRLTIERLTTQQVDLPAFALRCPAGRYKMTKDQGLGVKAQPWLIKVAHANLDDDSALETAALVQCVASELEEAAVVAFDLDRQGSIVQRGLIVKGSLWDVLSRSQGGVTVDISDIGTCCRDRVHGIGAELHQQRAFAWVAGKFSQVGGPTRFVPHDGKIDLKLALKSFSWGPQFKEATIIYRKATIALEVTNLSNVASGQWVIYPDGDARGISGVGVHQPALAAGANGEITIELRHEAGHTGSFPVTVYELGATEVGGDLNVDNNSVRITNPAR